MDVYTKTMLKKIVVSRYSRRMQSELKLLMMWQTSLTSWESMHFADLTKEEFKAARNGLKIPICKPKITSFRYENVTVVPTTMDWRTKGSVTPIKDQGQCGSCWAFSAIAPTEGITKLSTGKLISLSEQELVDCDRKSEDQGCEGGYMEDAFKFIVKNKGITTETTYPYKAADGKRNTKKESSRVADIKGYEKVPKNNEKSLINAVANQPISVSIDASHKNI